MLIQYLYWAFVVVAGAYIAYVGRERSWRGILAIVLVGIFAFLFGLSGGLAGDFSSSRILKLLVFHEKFMPYPSVYPPIALGYALVLGGLSISVYRVFGNRNASSNPSFEKDA